MHANKNGIEDLIQPVGFCSFVRAVIGDHILTASKRQSPIRLSIRRGMTDGVSAAAMRFCIPVDDFRYLREGGFQEGQQIVTFRSCQPLLSVRQADNLTVSQPPWMRIYLHRKEMQTSRGSRQPPGAGEQQRCPAICQRLTKLFRKREDFHATAELQAASQPGTVSGRRAPYQQCRASQPGAASVAVTQNVALWLFHHYRLCPGYITPPRDGAICCQLFSNASHFCCIRRKAAHYAFRHREIAIPCGPFPCPTMPVRR